MSRQDPRMTISFMTGAIHQENAVEHARHEPALPGGKAGQEDVVTNERDTRATEASNECYDELAGNTAVRNDTARYSAVDALSLYQKQLLNLLRNRPKLDGVQVEPEAPVSHCNQPARFDANNSARSPDEYDDGPGLTQNRPTQRDARPLEQSAKASSDILPDLNGIKGVCSIEQS